MRISIITILLSIFACDGICRAATIFVNPDNGDRYFVTDAAVSWQSAESLAVSLGGHLASITDAAENQWVFQTLPLQGQFVWLGGYDIPSQRDRQFYWASGEPLNYINWAGAEPDTGFLATSYIAGVTFNVDSRLQQGKWVDLYGQDGPLHAVVELPAAVVPAPPTVWAGLLLLPAVAAARWLYRSQPGSGGTTHIGDNCH